MPRLTLTGSSATGSFVAKSMFGANAVFERTEDGAPGEAYSSAATNLGVTSVRFGGGQSDLPPTRLHEDGETPVDGEDWINIVTMPDGNLRTEVVNFFEWCGAGGHAGPEADPLCAVLVIPTKHLNTEDYAGFADDIAAFVEAVMGQYGHLIEAFQIGNEYWDIGETAYGQRASIAAEAVETGMVAAGIAQEDQPSIIVQMATAGNAGSEFQATPGVNDFRQRNDDANRQIIDQLSDAARGAIDGVTEHYYYNKKHYEFGTHSNELNFIDRDYDLWSESFDKDLDLHITEWNVRTTTTAQHGFVAGSTLIKQFSNMIELGVDAANIWALDYHSRTALTLETDGGAITDDQGRMMNSSQAAAFDLMAGSIAGKELISFDFDQTFPQISVTAYGDQDTTVLYVSSRTLESMDVSLDLSQFFANASSINGVKVSLDTSTTNGLQWDNGIAADGITIDGDPYFYNEHDADVLFTDFSYTDASNITFDLKPFEFLELTIETPPDPVQPTDSNGSEDDDLIIYDDLLDEVEDNLSDAAEDIGGQAYRLYQATFDRIPDEAGLEFWIGQQDGGTLSLNQIKQHYIVSDEFTQILGNHELLNDAQFLDLLYQNMLERMPDQADYDFWSAQQQNGLTRAEMLTYFSESDEVKTNVSAAVEDGIWFI
ncbi:DUF4214 domain-containing protein [Sulfitobacter mediterraneus]|uniref:DUF4214 domain-containing protein n=2 Tax=Sulfitobacter mediterraneus TaxID=83219 RepID=UPI00193A83DC|nr:DUF4214 domain-containing protein [Sulfitobacter mediterraneus]MBM1313005.1 DUF4214 domain-containing protein [Sulfitobacter mediterraneus]MBM1416057.1 DUF4214 domain-containing protein [Sulfitobacter mediterraneus]MBM1427709.1 DUF4214 domain-containing protein [Sulfitobacter mediterraneus]MBM1447385.1 DUF4214 domain-containing protein [Sulfitobacter mediterraneus]MBM1458800.1 DUF4214 domain-containing protein [Sulfitobacter mediterraneus]